MKVGGVLIDGWGDGCRMREHKAVVKDKCVAVVVVVQIIQVSHTQQ